MPELPEVERAARMIRDAALEKVIEGVATVEDSIVYSGGITHEDYAKELTGRKIIGVGRYGKVFYITLDGPGRMPVLHLGMTGMVQVKGADPVYYRRKPRQDPDAWPPRFMKFIFQIAGGTEIAFMDARRLSRIRLCASPLTEHPISALGFDPILCMPSVEDFTALVRKRGCTTKALLLDQSFSAGVGNWVADEILYQARIHPEHRANALSDGQIRDIHDKMVFICQTAVGVNADASKFPEDWLFHHRWGKGKKTKHTLKLPSGEPATIKWATVGGRTSAYVQELQKLAASATVSEDKDGEEPKPKGSHRAKKRKAVVEVDEEDDDEMTEEESTQDVVDDYSPSSSMVRKTSKLSLNSPKRVKSSEMHESRFFSSPGGATPTRRRSSRLSNIISDV